MTFKLRNPACLIIFGLQIAVWFGMILGASIDLICSLVYFSLAHLILWVAMGISFKISLGDWKVAPWTVVRDFLLLVLGNGHVLLFYVLLFWIVAEEGSF